MANWKSDALDCPRGAAEAVFVEKHKSFETFEFREPYQICGVQSFGEKRAFRRKMTRLCRFGVRSLNEESLLMLGLIADKIARRIHLFGKAGGAREIRTLDTACLLVSACKSGSTVTNTVPRRRGDLISRRLTGANGLILLGSMVPRGGIEPPTLRFSVAMSRREAVNA